MQPHTCPPPPPPSLSSYLSETHTVIFQLSEKNNCFLYIFSPHPIYCLFHMWPAVCVWKPSLFRTYFGNCELLYFWKTVSTLLAPFLAICCGLKSKTSVELFFKKTFVVVVVVKTKNKLKKSFPLSQFICFVLSGRNWKLDVGDLILKKTQPLHEVQI